MGTSTSSQKSCAVLKGSKPVNAGWAKSTVTTEDKGTDSHNSGGSGYASDVRKSGKGGY